MRSWQLLSPFIPCSTPARASAGKNEFGGPRRRGTDVLMAINVTVFVLQFLTKDKLLLWGAKVGGRFIFQVI